MRFFRMFLVVAALAAVAPVLSVHAAQPPSQSEFVPMSDIPQAEQIPAFTMVGSAYGFVWVALLGYVWTIARRLQKVEAELADLESRGK